MTRMSEPLPSAGCVVTSGEIATATVVEARITSGARGRTTLAFNACRRSLVSSFRRSLSGWLIGAPTRPSARALILAIKPISSGPPSITATIWRSVAVME